VPVYVLYPLQLLAHQQRPHLPLHASCCLMAAALYHQQQGCGYPSGRGPSRGTCGTGPAAAAAAAVVAAAAAAVAAAVPAG